MTAFDKAWSIAKRDKWGLGCGKCGGPLDPPGWGYEDYCATCMEGYTRSAAETDIINGPFSQALGWVDENGELTQAGREVSETYPGEDESENDCPVCGGMHGNEYDCGEPKEEDCDHEWGADKWVCTNKGCQAEITDADTEDVGDCLNHDDHNWKPQNYKCQKCGEREDDII